MDKNMKIFCMVVAAIPFCAGLATDMGSFTIGVLTVATYCVMKVIMKAIQKGQDKTENKSGNASYVYQRYENSAVIGGTNLDRFFVECVLSDCNDFTKQKNIEKAKLLADKYNLTYSGDIENLYKRGEIAHKKVSDTIHSDKIAKLQANEKIEFSKLSRYSECKGKEKRITMLTDEIKCLRVEAKSLKSDSDFILRMGQQKETDWAVMGGIASGIAGAGAGIATALNVQAENAQIRAKNEAYKRSVMPAHTAMWSASHDKDKAADNLQKELDEVQEKLIAGMGTDDVFSLLKIAEPKVIVSETGAFKVLATVEPKQKLYVFEDVPAIVDGTILAHVFDGEKEIGTAKMVLPIRGVSTKTKIKGMSLSGATLGTEYTVSFTGYNLWMMEK